MPNLSGSESEIVEQVTEEIAQVAAVLVLMGACKDCAVEAAFDVVTRTLAVEAPRVLAVYRDALRRALTAQAN